MQSNIPPIKPVALAGKVPVPVARTEYNVDCRRANIYYGEDFMFFNAYPKKDPIEDNHVTTHLIWNQKAHHPKPVDYPAWSDVHPGVYRPSNYDPNAPYYTNLVKMRV